MHLGLFLCTSTFILGLPLNRTSTGFLFLHQYLLLFITVEADAHISTILAEDGDILMRLLPVR